MASNFKANRPYVKSSNQGVFPSVEDWSVEERGSTNTVRVPASFYFRFGSLTKISARGSQLSCGPQLPSGDGCDGNHVSHLHVRTTCSTLHACTCSLFGSSWHNCMLQSSRHSVWHFDPVNHSQSHCCRKGMGRVLYRMVPSFWVHGSTRPKDP